MSRDSNGNYSLPAGNPVVTGTIIESAWANTTMSDVGTALNNSLDRTGKGGMTAALKHVDGTVSAPGMNFNDETNTGIYRSAAATLDMALAGVRYHSFTAGEHLVIDTSVAATVGPTLDLHRDSASPAASDLIGEVIYSGEDDGGTKTTYAAHYAVITDPTDASEDGQLVFQTMQAGTLTTILTLNSDATINIAGDLSVSGTVTDSGGGSGSFIDLTLTDSDAGAAIGPELTLFRDSASPADNDLLGVIYFDGNDDGAAQTTFAAIYAQLIDTTNGTEDGDLILQTMQNGTLTTVMTLDSDGDVTFAGGTNVGGTTTYTGAVTYNSTATYTGDVTIEGSLIETVFAISDGASVTIDVSNGTIQTWTLGANRVLAGLTLGTGASLTLQLDLASFTFGWSTFIDEWIDGAEPTLDATNTNVIVIWNDGANVNAKYVGALSAP